MNTIRISARNIDELNFIYRKIKKEFSPVDSIKLNKETMDYEMILKRNELDGALKAICKKVIESDELLDGVSVFDTFTWEQFNSEMNIMKVKIQFRSLKGVWDELTAEKRKACYNYLCQEMNISSEEDGINNKLVA